MAKGPCHLCGARSGARNACEVCQQQQFCSSCCKRFLSLPERPQQPVRTCNECYLRHVAWDPTRWYDVHGDPAHKTVVLVHDVLVGRHSLLLEAWALAEVGFRVIVPDLPGHGSRFREGCLTLDSAVATVLEVVQQEAPGQKVLLMGFRLGAFIAAAFAAAHPQLLSGVLLAGCCYDPCSLRWQAMARITQARYALTSHRHNAQLMFEECPEVMSPQRAEVQECFLRAGAEYGAWRLDWRVMRTANMRKLLPSITCPALLVVGEHDSRDHERKWLGLLQHGGLLVLRGGTRHFLLQPDECHEWRMQAEGFAVAATWDQPPKPSSSASGMQAGCEALGSSSSVSTAAEAALTEVRGAHAEVHITLAAAAQPGGDKGKTESEPAASGLGAAVQQQQQQGR